MYFLNLLSQKLMWVGLRVFLEHSVYNFFVKSISRKFREIDFTKKVSFGLLLGRVAMSMTTMLTLSSMFSSLTTITPPISYATKLDTWMVMCIVFVFGTLFEFTVVIFLKYYLKYLPYINVDVFSTPTPSGGKTKVLDIKSQVQAWMKVGNITK